MPSELEQAVNERVALGHTKEQIRSELQAAGYDNETIEQVYNQAVANPTVGATLGATGVQLIGYIALIKASFQLVSEQAYLFLVVALYGLGLFAITGLAITFVSTQFISLAGISTMLIVTIVIAAIVGMLALSFGFMRALLRRGEQLPFITHIQWALPNIVGLLLVTLYIQFATSLGYLLFILPGIALAIYLSFAMLVRIDEKETGVMALVRSTQLVYDRWWGVLARTLFATLVFILCTVPVFIVATLLAATTGVLDGAMAVTPDSVAGMAGNMFEAITFGLLVGLAILFISFLMQCAMVVMYESLRATAVPFTPDNEKKLYLWMRVAVVIGIPVAIFINGYDAYLELNEPIGDIETIIEDPTAFQQQLIDEQAETQAELEAFMQEFESEFEAN